MRLSRKAGLLACGVRWIKYACSMYTETSSRYLLGAQQQIDSGWDTTGNTYYQGLSSYTFNSVTGTVYASGNQTYVDMAHPGVVYEDNGTDGTSIYGYSVRGDGYYQVFTKTVEKATTTTTTYTVKEKIGTVRAPDGEYPDAKKGYIYVTTDNGYTIMTDGNGNFYAYEPALRSDSVNFTATIQDDVLVVRGDGVATIENGILYVRC